MRWLSLLLLLPLVAAHGEHDDGGNLQHIQREDLVLEPGRNAIYSLDFAGQPFTGGWEWLIRADVDGDVGVRLTQLGQTVDQWEWGTGSHTETTTIPDNGTLLLEFSNDGSRNATVAFYYDQTCRCLFKLVPLAQGPVWFNIDAEKGDRVSFNYTVFTQPIGPDGPTPTTVTVRATHVTLHPWREHASVEHSFTVGEAPCHGGARWNACFDVAFTAKESGMQTIWFELEHDGGAGWAMAIRPLSERTPQEEAPGMALPMLLLALVVAVQRRAT